MKRNIINSIWNRLNRNGINANFEYLFELRGLIEKVVIEDSLTPEEYAELTTLINGLLKSGEVKQEDLENDLQTFLNDLETTSASTLQEVENARGDHTVLGGRLNGIESQLSQESNARIGVDNRAFYEGVKLNRRHKAIMTIVDDDGYPQVYDMLKPLVEQEGVPITSAVITGRVGTSSLSMNLQQIKECQAVGMEIQSHTVNHKPLATLTYAEKESEIRESKRWLQENGLYSDALIYPFGSVDSEVYELTNLYYSAGVYIDGGSSVLNNPPIRRERLERVYYNLTEPVAESDKNRIQHCKDKIDEAIANNSWIIIGLHCFYDGFDPEGLREVIRYAKQKGIEIVTLKKGLELYGNVIDLPDFKIGSDGKLTSYTHGHFQQIPHAPNASDPIGDYPKNAVSYRVYNTSQATAAGMPNNSAGTYFVFRAPSDQYAFRKYILLNSNDELFSFWDNTNLTWSEWVCTGIPPKVSQISTDIKSINRNGFSYASTPSTDKPTPPGHNGYVTTKVLSDLYKAFVFQNYRTGDLYTAVTFNGTFSGWSRLQKISSGNRPTSHIPEGFQHFDSDLGKPIWRKGSGWVDANGTTV